MPLPMILRANTPKIFSTPGNAPLMPYVLRQVKKMLAIPQTTPITLRKNGRSAVIDVPGQDTLKIRGEGARGFALYDLDGSKLHAFGVNYVYGPALLDGAFYDEKYAKACIRAEDLLQWLPRLDAISYVLHNDVAWFCVNSLATLVDDVLDTKLNNKFFVQNLTRVGDTNACYKNLKVMVKEGLQNVFGIKASHLDGDCMALAFTTFDGLRHILGSEKRAPKTEQAISRLRTWFDSVSEYPMPEPAVHPLLTKSVDSVEIPQMLGGLATVKALARTHATPHACEQDASETKPKDKDMETESTALALAEFFPDAGDAKIRITPAGLISVYDVMRFFGYANPRDAFASLKEDYPEGVGRTDTFQFNGRGQNPTPVTSLETIIQLVNVMKTPKVDKYRTQFAKVITRYIRGDMSLVDEVIKNNERVRQLPEDSPIRAVLNVHAEVKQFCDENNLRFLNLQTHNGIPGIYCIIIGLYKNVLTFKVGCAHDIKKRLEQHLAEYPKLGGEYFQAHVCPIYACQTSSYRVAELSLKRILRSLGVRLKNVALDGRKEDTELFTLSNGMSIEHVLDILQSQSEDANAVVPTPVDLDHEYRMRQLDVSLEMRKVEVSLDLAREKTRQMELQLEILKLGGQLPNI